MLIVSVLLAATVGLGLIALGWWAQGWEYRAGWSRLSDPAWWTGEAVRWLGHLMLGRFGLKVAIVVVGVMVYVGWRRRDIDAPDSSDGCERPLEGDKGNP
jgi:heme/copper-type cytochrome/quinol oxidase subunit 2